MHHEIELQVDSKGQGYCKVDGRNVAVRRAKIEISRAEGTIVTLSVVARSLLVKATTGTFTTARDGRQEPGIPLQVDDDGRASILLLSETRQADGGDGLAGVGAPEKTAAAT